MSRHSMVKHRVPSVRPVVWLCGGTDTRLPKARDLFAFRTLPYGAAHERQNFARLARCPSSH